MWRTPHLPNRKIAQMRSVFFEELTSHRAEKSQDSEYVYMTTWTLLIMVTTIRNSLNVDRKKTRQNVPSIFIFYRFAQHFLSLWIYFEDLNFETISQEPMYEVSKLGVEFNICLLLAHMITACWQINKRCPNSCSKCTKSKKTSLYSV